MGRLGYLLASGGLRVLKTKIDPRQANGGVFLGVNGIVVKSHGSADAFGFANAVDITVDMIHANIAQRIARDIEILRPTNQKQNIANQPPHALMQKITP